MPRQRSPDSIEAERLWKEEKLLLKDIAQKLGVPESTVRRWKSTQKWGQTKGEHSETKKANARNKSKANVRKPKTAEKPKKGEPAKKKRGAPFGNKNGVNNCKPGNQLALKHGGYSKVYWDTLSDDERRVLEETSQDEEEQLIKQIQLYEISEYRIMNAIKKYRDMVDPVTGKDIPIVIESTVRQETKRVFDGSPEEQQEAEQKYKDMVAAEVDRGDRKPGRTVNITTTTENKDNKIARLIQELTTVQSKKTSAIQALAKIRADKEENNSGNDLVHAWAEAVLKARDDE